jgi:hypothetical protein
MGDTVFLVFTLVTAMVGMDSHCSTPTQAKEAWVGHPAFA